MVRFIFACFLAGAGLAAAESGIKLPGVWLEAESSFGHPGAEKTSSSASGGKFVSWINKGSWLAWDLNLPADMAHAVIYLRYSRGNGDKGSLDISLGPVDAVSPDHAGLKIVAHVAPAPTGEWDKEFNWVSAPLGSLKAGIHKLFVSCPVQEGGVDLDVVGVMDDQNDGLWQPPNQVENGKLAGEGSVQAEAEFVEMAGPELGNLLPEKKYMGPKAQPVAWRLTLKNPTARPSHVAVSAMLFNDLKKEIPVPAKDFTLPAGKTTEIVYAFPAPGYGWYGARIRVNAGKVALEKETSFCVLHTAAEGVRPNSVFGLSFGMNLDENPTHREIGRLLGAKWRRGVPNTDISTVSPAQGKWWGEAEIQKARQSIKDWKDAGILCQGYVNYNAAWNVTPDPLGRPIALHQNRPKDLKAHAEIVYHLIKPLHDLVPNWQLWNEPWIHSWTWRTGSAQDYRDMCREIWEKVKPEMPEVQIIGGGSTSYLRDVVFAKGSANAGYVDAVNTHPYRPPDGYFCARAAVEAAMARQWAKGKGKAIIWADEFGTLEGSFPDLSLEEQRLMAARALAPQYLLSVLGAGDTPVHAFFFRCDYDGIKREEGFNFFDGKVPKPVVAAYSAMTHFLEDCRLQGDLWKDSRLGWALHFVKNDGSSVIAFWPEDKVQGGLALPAAGWQAFDYLGRPLNPAGGKINLNLRQWETCYLLNRKPAGEVAKAFLNARFQAVQPLRVNPRSLAGPLRPGAKLRVKIENELPQIVDARLSLQTGGKIQLKDFQTVLKNMKPGEVRFAEFEVVQAKPDPQNRYLVRYEAEAGGLKQEGSQVVQAAFAAYGSPKIGGGLLEWKDAVPVSMLSQGGKDYQKIILNPDLMAKLLADKGASDSVVYKLWTLWDEKSLYLAAEIPDSSLATNSTFEDDPYALPFDADSLQIAFHCLQRNPDDLLWGNPLYRKAMAADADYEFIASLARYTGDGESFSDKPAWKGDWSKAKRVPELRRLRAPGTNFQTFYPTNALLNPALGLMDGKVQIAYDDERKVYRYEIAIPWSDIPELGEKVRALAPGKGLTSQAAFCVNDSGAGGRGRTFWQKEAGDVECGAYGFSPTWSGGSLEAGGRITTDWGFTR